MNKTGDALPLKRLTRAHTDDDFWLGDGARRDERAVIGARTSNYNHCVPNDK